MANGDIAAAAGLPVVPPTADIRLGYDEINKTRDEVGTHMTVGTHTWDKVLDKPATYPATAHDHNDLYLTEGESFAQLAGKADAAATTAALAGKATKSNTGALAVGSINGQQIGLRYEYNAVFKVDGSEFELASLIRVLAIEARLTAHGI